MKSFNRVSLMLALVVVALLAAACGGGSGGGASTADGAAKAWFEALLKADGTALRNNMCDAQKAAITDAVVSSIATSLSGAGATMDTANVTYTVNGSNVTLGGTMKITAAGQSTDLPMDSFPLGTLPVVQEGGTWKVCLDLSQGLGG